MKTEDIKGRGLELRQRSRERLLEAAGIEVDAVKAAEKETEREFDALIEDVRGTLADSGGDIAEAHDRSLKRADLLMMKQAEQAMVSREHGRFPEPARLMCDCFFYWPTTFEQNDYEPLTGDGTGSVTYDPAEVAHPIVEAKSPGVGAMRTATITPWWMYSFTPTQDRMYCIKPRVQMSGHWLLWTWGTCAGTPLGTGKVRVKVTTQVDQLSMKLASKEVLVLDESAAGGADKQSGFAFDSTVDDGLRMVVSLSAGDQAVVWVKCELYAEISNQGRAWVDMQTSPAFYCKTPAVYRSLLTCWPAY